MREDLISAHKHLQGRYQENGARHFSVVLSERTRGNRHKLEHRSFHLNMTRNFFTLRVTEHWHSLPRELLESLSLQILKTHLGAILCNLLWVNSLSRELGLGDPQRSLPTLTML